MVVSKAKNKSSKQSPEFNLDTILYKYYWLIIPVLALVYYVYSFISTGFYTDDEIVHFLNMRDFWTNPGIIIGNWPKPGWKIFMTVPSLAGYNFVLFFNSLIASATVYFTILLARKYEFRNTFALIFLLGLQPTFWELSFRSYAEIFTGLIIVLMCYLFVIKKYKYSMLLSGYLFLLRQETALIIIVLIVYLFYKKEYYAVLYALIFPVLLQIIGTITYNGNYLWMIEDITKLKGMDFNTGTDRGFFFYFSNYIFIIGPAAIAFLIAGYFSFFGKNINKSSYFKKYDIIYIVFTGFFLTQCYLVWQGTNAGLLRYMLPASPLAAIFALIGINNLIKTEYKNLNLGIFSAVSVITLLFLSKETNGWFMTEQTEHVKFFIVLIITITFLVTVYLKKSASLKAIYIVTIVLSIFYVYHKVQPLKLSNELVAVKDVTHWYTSSEFKDRPLLYSHTAIPFYLYNEKTDKKNKIYMTLEELKKAPAGSICIWDSHYSYNPRYENRNTNYTFFQNNSNYKLIKDFNSNDKNFKAFVFEKITDN